MNHRWDTSGERLRRRRTPAQGVKCTRCQGEGKYVDYDDTAQARYFRGCERCGGTGYVEEEEVGETISYSGGDIPYVDRVVEITPDTPKPDIEVMGEIKVLRALLEEREREVERLRSAIDGHLVRLDIFSLKYDMSRDKVKVDYEWIRQPLEAAREREERNE